VIGIIRTVVRAFVGELAVVEFAVSAAFAVVGASLERLARVAEGVHVAGGRLAGFGGRVWGGGRLRCWRCRGVDGGGVGVWQIAALWTRREGCCDEHEETWMEVHTRSHRIHPKFPVVT
jgi:hypothetical protein